jgi:hypothetical protein
LSEFSEAKIKHLEMLQKIIERMAAESGRIKQIALATAGAIISVAASVHNFWIPLAGIMLTAIFWYLDAKYLTQERWFRDLFEIERKERGEASFVLTPPAAVRAKHHTTNAMTTWSTAVLYSGLVVINLAVSLALYESGSKGLTVQQAQSVPSR